MMQRMMNLNLQNLKYNNKFINNSYDTFTNPFGDTTINETTDETFETQTTFATTTNTAVAAAAAPVSVGDDGVPVNAAMSPIVNIDDEKNSELAKFLTSKFINRFKLI